MVERHQDNLPTISAAEGRVFRNSKVVFPEPGSRPHRPADSDASASPQFNDNMNGSEETIGDKENETSIES